MKHMSVIVALDPGTAPLTKEERKNYKKNHPGERLCFRLRYPNFPIVIHSINVAISLTAIIIALMRLLK